MLLFCIAIIGLEHRARCPASWLRAYDGAAIDASGMGKFSCFGVDGMSAVECIARRNNVRVNDYSGYAETKSDDDFVIEGRMRTLRGDRMNSGDGRHCRG